MHHQLLRYFALIVVSSLFFVAVQAPGVPATAARALSVDVEVVQGYDRYMYASGYAASEAEVEIRVKNGEQLRNTVKTVAGADGWYRASLQANWSYEEQKVRPGDTVEVVAGGSIITTHVVTMTAQLDPFTQQLSGRTAPGRVMNARLIRPRTDACGVTESEHVLAAADGFFRFDLREPGFDGKATASVCARDEAGNGVCIYRAVEAYHLDVRTDFNEVEFWLPPNVEYTETLAQGDQVLEKLTGRLNVDGNNTTRFYNNTIKPGMTVRVEGGGVTLQTVILTMVATVHPASEPEPVRNSIDIRTTQGTLVYVWTQLQPGEFGNCNYRFDCARAMTEADGHARLRVASEIVRGQSIWVSLSDEAGNSQSQPGVILAPDIIVDPATSEVSGHWPAPSGWVTVTLTRPDGTQQHQAVAPGQNSDQSYSAQADHPLAAGEVISVGDGVYTATTTVQEITARLDGATGRLAGAAPPGMLRATPALFQCGTYGHTTRAEACIQQSHAGGTFDVPLSGGLGPGSSALVYYTGPDGHYTRLTAVAFQLGATLGTGPITGHASPGSFGSTTVSILRGGQLQARIVVTPTQPFGQFEAALQAGMQVLAGDILQLESKSGSYASRTPDLTAQAGPTTYEMMGNAPPDQALRVGVNRYNYMGPRESSWGQATADANGRYVASFAGKTWTYFDGQPVEPGQRCSRLLANACINGDEYWFLGPEPKAPGADVFERDNTPESASLYSGPQHHTFHYILKA